MTDRRRYVQSHGGWKVMLGLIALFLPHSSPALQVVEANIRIGFGINPSISINDGNPQQLFVTAGRIMTLPGFWAFSTDAGLTWPASLAGNGLPPPIISAFGEPVALIDRDARAYFFILGNPAGVYLASTTNLGAQWGARSNADPLSSTADDRIQAAVDLSGIYPHNAYSAWTDFNVSGSPIQFTFSTNNGATWSSRRTLAIGASRGQGPHIATGPNGEVYVSWAHYGVGTAESGLGFARSTDGGATFTISGMAFAISGIRTSNGGVPQFNNLRVSSFPSIAGDRSNGERRGWIYVSYADRSAGDADVYMRRSTDRGDTWSGPVRVNDDSLGNGRQQWDPSIAVDPVSGDIAITYFTMDSVSFWTSRSLAYSTNGGSTWQNLRISEDRFFLADTVGGKGTPDQTAAYDGRVWGVWSNGVGVQLGRVDFNTTSVTFNALSLPERVLLAQNYPNPFNPETSFRFQVSSSRLVELRVYDVLGREVATLVNEVKAPGEYTIPFDASGLASGVYFYKMTSGDFVDARKMIIMK